VPTRTRDADAHRLDVVVNGKRASMPGNDARQRGGLCRVPVFIRMRFRKRTRPREPEAGNGPRLTQPVMVRILYLDTHILDNPATAVQPPADVGPRRKVAVDIRPERGRVVLRRVEIADEGAQCARHSSGVCTVMSCTA
jgi:hypothetical protein